MPLGGYTCTVGSSGSSVLACGVLLCGFDRRFPEEKGRLELRDSAGTRNAQTEWEAAMPRLDGRKACVRALRKHVCAVLIGGMASQNGERDCMRLERWLYFFHDDDDSRSSGPPY